MQMAVATTPGDQLVLAHRQRGKSRIAAAMAEAMACQKPGSLTLLVSRSLRQASELFKKVREFHNLALPMPLRKDTEHELEYTNGSRIISLPASSETIVGYSAVDLLILDEAARIQDETYYAVRPMLARSQGTILAISTPFGKRGWFYEAYADTKANEKALDLATIERLLADLDFPVEEYSETSTLAAQSTPGVPQSSRWSKVFAPVTWHPQLSKAYIAQERLAIPDLWFRQEWCCEFVDLGDTVFNYDDLQAIVSSDISPLYDDSGALATTVRPLSLGNGVWES